MREVNFDGLVGPSHNYGGLSFGNVASARNAGAESGPRQAALQGVRKMRRMRELYPDINIKLLKRQDIRDMMVKFGLDEEANRLFGTLAQEPN